MGFIFPIRRGQGLLNTLFDGCGERVEITPGSVRLHAKVLAATMRSIVRTERED